MSTVRLNPVTVKQVKTEESTIPRGVRKIKAPALWKQGYRGDQVVVAVLDTGCQRDHPDLRQQIIGGYNFTNDYNGNHLNYSDNHGHGTHVCGTIAAAGEGVTGVAPKAKLLVLKVVNGTGEGEVEDIVSGIDYAIGWTGPRGEKVRIISMSLGTPDDPPSLHNAIKRAVANNIIVVCAAGNEGDGRSNTQEYNYPGAYEEVVEVGSVSYSQRPSWFSNTNSQLDLVAPGEKVLSTYPGSQYASLSGTSMAAPHVSGALALLIEKHEKERNRRLTEPELYELLIRNTKSLGYPRSQQGHGMLHLNRR
ncbi:S8 family peptidase [Bacillus sp. V5-8f]|uniref:S8 family peptidase n=1 Tax=Bacillus sp. V5-8f TaxID=2053044 RepID=UPI000C774E8A|nr:S8 family peptidase [Bacillus sp. V5-8f]PLT32735.1 serine protease [Bacillus sp. V5-8f]